MNEFLLVCFRSIICQQFIKMKYRLRAWLDQIDVFQWILCDNLRRISFVMVLCRSPVMFVLMHSSIQNLIFRNMKHVDSLMYTPNSMSLLSNTKMVYSSLKSVHRSNHFTSRLQSSSSVMQCDLSGLTKDSTACHIDTVVTDKSVQVLGSFAFWV